jgi:glycosyltransferase involved in cell wall biosynthesis
VTPPIEAVAVVVPAHDEEELLPAALRALRESARLVAARGGPPVDLLVVADACRDRTAAVAIEAGARVLPVEVRSVGRARAAGVADALRRVRHLAPSRVWLATTDADSRVPPGWLGHQLALADAGADLVLGTVDVLDWSGHAPEVERRWRASYDAGEGHRHVHGANAGARADAYLDAVGFADVDRDEDVALAAALGHRRVVRTGGEPVVTSARHRGRAPGGFAGHLAGLGRLAEELAARAQCAGSQGSGSTSVELT